MTLSVYLAGRFSRLPEIALYADDLELQGVTVTSRWLRGGHEWVGTADEEIPVPRLARFAQDDIDDIDDADMIVCFTEPARSGPARGGRHFEAGYAFATGKRVVVVGHRENVFYCLPQVRFFDQWADARRYLLVHAVAETEVPA